jgi:DNA-binding transcriptional ArsR family regulator
MPANRGRHFLFQPAGCATFLYRIFAMDHAGNFAFKSVKMAIAKREMFSKNEQDLAAFAKALSHPARVAILKVLASHNECICGEIVEVLPLAQSTVSQHLKELKAAGLIRGEVDGPKSCYCINWKAFEKFKTSFNHLFDTLKAKNNKCCE